MSRILIAGFGYIGEALGLSLAQAGHVVFGLRRRPVASSHSIESFAADLNDAESLSSLPSELDFVFYTVSPDERTDEAYRKAYVEGLRNLLRALEPTGAKRLFLTSSTGVYEQKNGKWVDESTPVDPKHFSGRRLLEAEQLLLGSRISSTVVRFGGIYGPGRTRLIQRVQTGKATYLADVTRFTNRIHRDDCVGCLTHLMSLNEPEPLYLGVDDEPTEQRELLQWLAETLDAPPPRPAAVQIKTRKGNKRCRNDRLRASGYRFRYADYRAGYGSFLKKSAQIQKGK